VKAMSGVQDVVNLLTQTRGAVSMRRSVLVAITGIDGCGKGYLTTQIVNLLRSMRMRIAAINVDADYAEETAGAYRRHVYDFENIDLIVLEGIYLLKRSFQPYYDLSCWIDCSFATALERAIARAQEGLSPNDTTHAYRSIYFPAQQIHFRRDEPRGAATLIVNNDARLVAAPTIDCGTTSQE
jgi:uridine kinase